MRFEQSIGIEENQHPPARGVAAEVSRPAKAALGHNDELVAKFASRLRGAVVATVANDDNFQVAKGLATESLESSADVILLVVCRNDDRNEWRSGGLFAGRRRKEAASGFVQNGDGLAGERSLLIFHNSNHVRLVARRFYWGKTRKQ